MYEMFLTDIYNEYSLRKGERSPEFEAGFIDNLRRFIVGDGMAVESDLKHPQGSVQRDAYRSGIQAGLAIANAKRGQRGLLDAFESSRQGMELRHEMAGMK